MNYPEELVGSIERFLFQNAENGYCVCLINTGKKEAVTVTGHLPGINAGQQVTLRGQWIIHPKFGKQFEASSCSATLPTSINGLKKYLSSGMIKGIGPSYAEKLVNHFGTNVLTIIDSEPERLQEVAGIGQARARKIIDAWQDQREIAKVMVFLQDKGISSVYAAKIYKTYGQNSVATVQENPYRLADEIWGIGFKTADQIAHKLGISKNSPARIRAGISHALSTATSQGHLYCELEQLKHATAELLELNLEQDLPLIKNALHEVYEQGKIKLISFQNNHYLALAQHYFSEKGVANKIKRNQEYPLLNSFNLDEVYQKLRAPQHPKDIVLNEEQQMGIMATLQNKITIITGGPGTGKTTLIKKLLTVLDEKKITYRLAAPTGRAAKRIQEGTGRHATTIHRLLEYDFVTRGFSHHEENALKLHFLIIDEASMIDIFLAHALLKALPLHAHLVLIGDVDQLPSVGAGNFLLDLIASQQVPCLRLKQIFRQAADSLIIVNAHRVNNGEFPVSFLPNAKRDFIFIKEDNPESVMAHVETIFAKLSNYGIESQDAILLTPMNRGAVGTQALNSALQNLLNPAAAQKHLTHVGTVFRVGDRVMQLRNNYEKLVFNGDCGIIEDIDTEDRVLKVSFGDRTLDYESNELDELVLAYAVTIHKSQGSEYAAAIIPLFMQHFTLLQRNLLYTAITRAKKLCILIGQPKAIGMAIGNNKGVKRLTFLQQFLTTDLQCR